MVRNKTDNLSSPGLLQTGVWYFVEFVYNNGKASIYLNSNLVAFGNGSLLPCNTALYIGTFGWGSATDYLNGYMDNIKLEKLR